MNLTPVPRTAQALAETLDRCRRANSDLSRVELKKARGGLPQTVQETLSSFSNTVGGLLVLGVSEKENFRITGVSDAGKVMKALSDAASEMEPPVRPQIEIIDIDGEQVVVAGIPEAPPGQKPVFIRSQGVERGAYLRVGDGDRRMTSYEIGMLRTRTGPPPVAETHGVAGASLADLDRGLVSGLLGRLRAQPGPFRGLSDEEALLTIGALRQSDEGPPAPTIAGLLALGVFPQRFFPALGVTFVVYPTEAVGEPGPGSERFLDSQRLEGPIPRLVSQAEAVIKRNMRRRSRVTGLFREDIWEYPETAIREAVVNALAHRDMSPEGRGTPVQIQMFPNRLVIVNPGGLFGPVTVERLGEAGVSSDRNPTLMRILEDASEPGAERTVAENRGSGIGAMIAALRQAGMRPPVFEDRLTSFVVTFPNDSLFDELTLSWFEKLSAGELNDDQRTLLANVFKGDLEFVSNAIYRRLTNVVDTRQATRDLSGLVTAGIFDRKGERGSTTYHLSDKAKAEANRVLLADRPKRPRGDRRAAIVEMLAKQSLSRREIEERLGLGTSAVISWLRVLREEGVVEMTGNPRDPSVRYRLRES